MGTGDDARLRERPKSISPSSILERHKPAGPMPPREDATPETGVKAFDKLTPLPRAGDPYKAYARPLDDKPLATLHFLVGRVSDGFAYGDLRRVRMLEGDDPGQGPVIVLYFGSIMPMEVRLEGRHLDTLHDLLSQHRCHWVRQWPSGRGFIERETPVVTSIAIKEMTDFPHV